MNNNDHDEENYHEEDFLSSPLQSEQYPTIISGPIDVLSEGENHEAIKSMGIGGLKEGEDTDIRGTDDEDDDNEDDEEWKLGNGKKSSLTEKDTFVNRLNEFYQSQEKELKSPKFYGSEVDLFKLWKIVVGIGGYKKVTDGKLWRSVGAQFNPPKCCTTVSYSFRNFYRKFLLEYEMSLSGEEIPGATEHDIFPTKKKRTAAIKAVRGFGKSVEELDEKSSGSRITPANQISDLPKNQSVISQMKPNLDFEQEFVPPESYGEFISVPVSDEGRCSDWGQVNVKKTIDGFEIFTVVPGLTKDEISVECDEEGNVLIIGDPKKTDSWGIEPFCKAIKLPSSIDTENTSALIALHGKLYIRLPFVSSEAPSDHDQPCHL